MDQEMREKFDKWGIVPTLANQLSYKYFGGLVQRKQYSISTNNVAAEIVSGNPDRIGLQLVNNSPATVYVGFTPDTASDNSIILTSSGGGLILKFRDDGQVCGDPIYGFCNAGGSDVTVIETILWG